MSDSNGAVTVNNNSFTMPAGNVTVTVTFKEHNFAPNGGVDERTNIYVKFYLNNNLINNNLWDVSNDQWYVDLSENPNGDLIWIDVEELKNIHTKSDFAALRLNSGSNNSYSLTRDNNDIPCIEVTKTDSFVKIYFVQN